MPDSAHGTNPASTAIAGLSRCASLVVAPKGDEALKHVEFVNLGPGRALVVLVTVSGLVENRVIDRQRFQFALANLDVRPAGEVSSLLLAAYVVCNLSSGHGLNEKG